MVSEKKITYMLTFTAKLKDKTTKREKKQKQSKNLEVSPSTCHYGFINSH